jgi:hypothetical protein
MAARHWTLDQERNAQRDVTGWRLAMRARTRDEERLLAACGLTVAEGWLRGAFVTQEQAEAIIGGADPLEVLLEQRSPLRARKLTMAELTGHPAAGTAGRC